MALELGTYSVEQTARSKCCAKTYGVYELAFAVFNQSRVLPTHIAGRRAVTDSALPRNVFLRHC